MEHEIKKARNLSLKDLREHVANLKYKPHLNENNDLK